MKMDWFIFIIPTPQDGRIACVTWPARVCQIANKTGQSRQGPPEIPGVTHGHRGNDRSLSKWGSGKPDVIR